MELWIVWVAIISTKTKLRDWIYNHQVTHNHYFYSQGHCLMRTASITAVWIRDSVKILKWLLYIIDMWKRLGRRVAENVVTTDQNENMSSNKLKDKSSAQKFRKKIAWGKLIRTISMKTFMKRQREAI